MKRFLSWATMFVALFAIVGMSAPAQAAPVVSDCLTGWYVNDDEGDLLPTQVETGLLFDGPSVVHHATKPVALKDVEEASLKATDVTGSAPLVKLETSKPYSTVNVLPSGLSWSSKIPAGSEGGQDKPVRLAALGELAPYGAETRVATFGAGYGNDSGNKATVTEITYGEAHRLACTKPTSSPSPTVKPSATASPTASPTTSASAAPVKPSASTSAAAGVSLPVTGSPIGTLAGLAGALLVGGAALLIWTRKRRV